MNILFTVGVSVFSVGTVFVSVGGTTVYVLVSIVHVDVVFPYIFFNLLLRLFFIFYSWESPFFEITIFFLWIFMISIFTSIQS